MYDVKGIPKIHQKCSNDGAYNMYKIIYYPVNFVTAQNGQSKRYRIFDPFPQNGAINCQKDRRAEKSLARCWNFRV